MMTFQELTDKLGSEAIYTGTSVDAATQAALLEWLFDRYLSMRGDDTTTWLRRYRRSLNMFYPMYQDYLRIESVRSNMDPFITEFMERIHDDEGTSTTSGSSTKNGTSSKSGSDTTITDNTQVRTPDLVTNGTTGNTRTDNIQTANTNRQTGTNGTTGTDNATDNTTNRNMNVIYPEANLGYMPADIDNFPSNINYAESEVDAFGKVVHNGSNSSVETKDLTTSDSGSQTGTVTDQGSNRVTETGDETIDFDGSVIRTSTGSDHTTETGTQSGQTIDRRKTAETEQGRHESIAELLPKAIQAITSTNSIKWLVNSLQLCFDNYSEM